MDGMRQFEPAGTEPADVRDTVRSALLLTVVTVLLTFSIVNGARLLASPPLADPILYAPIGW